MTPLFIAIHRIWDDLMEKIPKLARTKIKRFVNAIRMKRIDCFKKYGFATAGSKGKWFLEFIALFARLVSLYYRKAMNFQFFKYPIRSLAWPWKYANLLSILIWITTIRVINWSLCDRCAQRKINWSNIIEDLWSNIRSSTNESMTPTSESGESPVQID